MSAGKKFIGLDVHQDTIVIAIADDGVDREVRYFGTIANRPEALHAALKKIGQDGAELRVCYESGPCGFVIYRFLAKIGVACIVISPSSMPRRPGEAPSARSCDFGQVEERCGNIGTLIDR